MLVWVIDRVSTVAAEFLDSVFDLPVVNMREASPLLFQSNARLQLTSQYRAKLIKLKVRKWLMPTFFQLITIVTFAMLLDCNCEACIIARLIIAFP